MDEEATNRILRALEGALAVFRDAEGRLTVADVRVKSVISSTRKSLLQQSQESCRPHRGTTPPLPFPPRTT